MDLFGGSFVDLFGVYKGDSFGYLVFVFLFLDLFGI